MASPAAPARLWPRALAFALLAGWMVWGPVWKQLLRRRSPAAFEWQMFSRLGKNVCSVRYVRRAPGGAEETLDRFALLGHADRAAAPLDVRRLKSVDDAAALGAKLCRKLEGRPDVRLYARCGGGDGGWREAAAGETNLCARRPKREGAAPKPDEATPRPDEGAPKPDDAAPKHEEGP
ncbi:MAG TPA: hypothetical protein VFS43_05535 [Polyangiaceae bacterium]|nr:hypothetical protein [Polyangiaceae bacterium]